MIGDDDAMTIADGVHLGVVVVAVVHVVRAVVDRIAAICDVATRDRCSLRRCCKYAFTRCEPIYRNGRTHE